jgi:hypothetical protein
LYDKFKFNEPWDSEHNLRVAEEMPEVFRSLYETTHNHTGYLAIVGSLPDPNLTLEHRVTNDLRHTTAEFLQSKVAIVEVQDTGVVWTDPRDLATDQFVELLSQGRLASGAQIRGKQTWVAMLDASVRRLPKGLSAKAAKELALGKW